MNKRFELFFLVLFTIMIVPISKNMLEQPVIIKHRISSPNIHDSINIDGNTDLIQTSIQEGWIGNGTSADPYQIDGYKIANVNISICISNTDLPFIISNCTLTESNYGVALFNVSNAQIKNNTIYDLNNEYFGIYLENSLNNIISNNYIYNLKWVGIEAQASNNNTIVKNRITKCFYRGIRITNSDYISILDNYISDCGVHGISFEVENSNSNNDFFTLSLKSSIVKRNIISNNTYSGLDIAMSSNFTIEGNIISENSDGIQIYGKNHSIIGNTVYNNQNNGIWQRYTENMSVKMNNFIGNNYVIVDKNGSLSQVFLSEDSESDYSYNYWSDLNNSDTYSIDGEGFDYSEGEFYLVKGLTHDNNPAVYPHILNLHILSRPRILYPNNHATLKGEIKVIWTPSIDYSGHTVSYSVYIWGNNDWRLIAQNVNTNKIVWNTTESEDSSDCRIKVISFCLDGLSTDDVSDESFDIRNHSQVDVAFIGGDISPILLALIILVGYYRFSPLESKKKSL